MSSEQRVARAETEGIEVAVRARYSEEHSQPSAGRWFFIYEVTISNRGEVPAQLVDRAWVITDARGHVEEVRGPGVVGEQPVLAPGGSYTYASGCPLGTAFGTMRGTYGMVRGEAERFEVAIPEFMLARQHALN